MRVLSNKNRKQAIESLEFYYLLKKLFFSLRDDYRERNNPLIIHFLNVLEGLYLWESKTALPYIAALTDQVFWESNEFYRETMQKFVNDELNALEFAEEFSDRLLADTEKANDLMKDFRKQVDIELNPDSFEFSKIISEFEIFLEVYQNEAEQLETKELSENELSFTQDSVLAAVKYALEKVNKYFTD